MAKPISTNGLAAAAALGHEPIILVKVDWSAGTQWYSDKDMILPPVMAEGRIISVGQLNGQKKQDSVGSVTNISIQMTDDDGSLKSFMDSSNVEYTKVTIFQHFQGLSYADLSQLFIGYMAGPIEWSEGQRTFKFDVETRLKDQEVGFSVDYIPPSDPNNIYALPNPSVPFLNPDAVDKAWPLCFGDPIHVPALLLETASKGYLKYPFRGPRDPSQPASPSPYQDDVHFYLQDGDGAFFPQDTLIDVDIDGYIFRGTLHQDKFTVSEPNVPKYENVFFGARDTRDADFSLPNVAWLATPISIVNTWGLCQDEFGGTTYFRIIRQEAYFDVDGVQWYKVAFDTPIIVPITGGIRLLTSGDVIQQIAKHGRAGWKVTYEVSTGGISGGSVGLSGEVNPQYYQQAVDILSRVAWRINAGAEVRLWKPFRKDVFVANLIPSNSVIGVWAERTTKEGVRELAPVPHTYYTITNGAGSATTPFNVTNLDGPYVKYPTLITLDPPLREYEGQRWGEQIYVTLKSTVRNNTSDQIKYLFDSWSLLSTDATSFTAVHTAVANYPSNFFRAEKQNVVELAERIAWQARIGIVLDDGDVQVKYLSARPAAVMTFDESMVVLRTMGLGFTSTEDIFTELRANYKLTYFPARRFEREYVYKSLTAIKQYGLRRRKLDFFIYNIPSLVKKSMDFWGWRIVNSWRKVRFKAAMEAIQLEIFDCVSLAFNDETLLNGAALKAIVDAYGFNPDNDTVDLELWLPYLSGSEVESTLAWTDDSGDVFPYDPTTKYLPAPADFQVADDESRFRITTRISAGEGALPGIVTSLVPNLDPVTMTDQPSIIVATIYADGYSEPATQVGVQSFAIDPTNPPSPSDHVAVTVVGNQQYAINSGTGASMLLAKISNIAGAPTLYQVDIFGNGFTNPATSTAVNAVPVDLAAANFGLTDRVAVFKAAGGTWIDTSHPWTTQQVGTVISAKITNVSAAPNYSFAEVTNPGNPSAGLKPGGITGTAIEWSGRGTGISMGFIVRVEKYSDGNWYIDFPIGTAGGGA